MTILTEAATSALSVSEAAELQSCEHVIERGLKTYYEVGSALMSIRDNRLYRVMHATFEDYCQNRWSMTRRYANDLIAASGVVQNLGTIVPKNEAQARELVDLEPEAQRLAWEVVKETAPEGKVTAAHVKSVVNVLKDVLHTGAIDDGEGLDIPIQTATLDHVKAAVTEETYERLSRQQMHIAEKRNGTPAALQSSDSNEWYTPAEYIEAARRVMGAIDLDPASNPFANRIVKASYYHTEATDGFAQTWYGRVWLNPPYGRDNDNESNQGKWSARLTLDYCEGRIEQAVLLVNAVTDRQWFAPLWDFPICFVSKRIEFYTDSDRRAAPTHGNVLVYFGKHIEAFAREFSPFGRIVLPNGALSEVWHGE